MLPRASTFVILLLAAACIFWSLVFYSYLGRPVLTQDVPPLSPSELSELEQRVSHVGDMVEKERVALRGLRIELEELNRKNKELTFKSQHELLVGAWHEPIPILVFVCNRAEAITNHLNALLSVRPSAQRFPIIISQDCDNEQVREAVAKFGDQVHYVKHTAGDKANITIPANHIQYTTYYRIARHYKLALDYVFNTLKHTSVVITEDDLAIAPDFFEYFSSTRKLLEVDPTLWCVSAWNDNGKQELVNWREPHRLYRSDFFSGLGWMMSGTLWKELGPMWPTGFWDDWMRDPLRRKNRVCIRPEISRTAMTAQGKSGASKGLFFDKHLIKVVLNKQPVDFARMDLGYLTKDRFDDSFRRTVYEDSIKMDSLDAQAELLKTDLHSKRILQPIRIEYTGNLDYIKKADALHIMHDFKAGVPRTAYQGVVSAFVNGRRVFLAPDRNLITNYDPSWSVPDNTPE